MFSMNFTISCCGLGHGVKILTIHFPLPTLGHSAQENVGNFIGAQRLRGVEIGWQLRDLLMVDAIDVEKAILHLHVQWLSSFATQIKFDASVTMTCPCLVSAECWAWVQRAAISPLILTSLVP